MPVGLGCQIGALEDMPPKPAREISTNASMPNGIDEVSKNLEQSSTGLNGSCCGEESAFTDGHSDFQGSYQVSEEQSAWHNSHHDNSGQSPRTPTRDALAPDALSSPSSTRSLRNVSPGTRTKQYFEYLRSEQEVIPSNANATRRLPARSDFPQPISLEILPPVSDDQIQKVVILLHDYTGSERSLDIVSRRLQKHYAESAFLLVRGQEGVSAGNSGYHWADSGSERDGTFVNACRILLLDIIKGGLIAKCGFNARDIIILGHGQGGMVALAAAASWETIEFAGTVSIGGPMPDCPQVPTGMKARTPALALGGLEGDINPTALRRMQKYFCHVTHHLRPTSQDSIPETFEEMTLLLEPLLDFLAHRTRREEWTKQAILSLDGGGIRGYGSLLILKALMDKIGDQEKTINGEDGTAESSFSPCSYKPISRVAESAQAPQSRAGSEISDTASFIASPIDDLSNASLYLPCHYFTYVAGTSTGGLISIMLSRFRMTVEECLIEYKNLGEKIFGHPRLLNKGGFPWHKFDHRVLERVIQDVTARYSEKSEFQAQFPSDEDLCRTIVLAYANHSKNQAPYLFRTYGAPPAPLDRTKSISRQKGERNQGPAPRLPIWQVARATSAAPGYFPPITIQSGSGRKLHEAVIFKDGGFGTNNPSKEACEDVVQKHGGSIQNVALFVSVGTGVRETPIFADRPGKLQDLKANIKGAIGQPARTRGAHDDMASSSDRNHFQYYRFDGGDRLGEVALDEWKSHKFASIRGKNPASGFKTIDKMDQATAWYLQKPAIQRDLTELAKLLVRRRRLRTRDVSAWDRYASASYYECKYKGCQRTQIDTGNLFKKHLKNVHNIKLVDEVIERDMRRSRHCWTYRQTTTRDPKLTTTSP